MKNQLKNKYNDDDGRVICSMDVEGMRWHDRKIRRQSPALKTPQPGQMTASESRRYTWYSVLAGLTIAGVFSVAWILFALFCTQVWFR
jgi:hypothetical protein